MIKPQRKVTLPLFNYDVQLRAASVAPLLSMLEFLTGLILYRYRAVNRTYREFMCTAATPCLEGSVQITHLLLLLTPAIMLPGPTSWADVPLLSEHTCYAERLNNETH